MAEEEHEVVVGGRKVFYRTRFREESNRTILLLHGMSFTSSDWEKNGLIDRISDLGYSVLAVDYPGFGRSAENDRYDFGTRDNRKFADFVKDFASETNRDFYCIVGPSMGGYITLSAISEYPEIAESAIVIGAAGLDSLKGMLPSVTARVLILWGSEDSTIPIGNGRKMHELIPDSRFEEISGAHHAAYLDRPDDFMAAVRSFLAGK